MQYNTFMKIKMIKKFKGLLKDGIYEASSITSIEYNGRRTLAFIVPKKKGYVIISIDLVDIM